MEKIITNNIKKIILIIIKIRKIFLAKYPVKCNVRE